MHIVSYAGARPGGRSLPPLVAAPTCCGTQRLSVALSFARDLAHDGSFTFYDPAYLDKACQQPWGDQQRMLSLGGWGFHWGPTVAREVWVANAVSSLKGMLERYQCTGLDVNFEEGLEAGGFPEAMAEVFAQLKRWCPSLLITIAPYRDVWPYYRRLWELASVNIDYINWQVYGELGPDGTADQIVAVYEGLAAEVGGYCRLTLGIQTDPSGQYGPQLAPSLEAFRRLKARGIGGAFTWALENSAEGGHQAERALLAIAAGQEPPPVPASVPAHPVPAPAPAPPAAALGCCAHKIRAGEYLWKIAEGLPSRGGRSVQEALGAILRLNPGITNPALVHPGQVVRVPCNMHHTWA